VEFPRAVVVLVCASHTVGRVVRKNKGAQYRELGATMRERRQRAGLTAKELAKLTEWHPLKISRIETGQYSIDVVDVITYLAKCGLYRRDFLDMEALCHEAERRPGFWLSPHGEWLEDSLRSLIYHENTAAVSTVYEPLLVHGLLQTAAYARARIAGATWMDPGQIEQAVRIRLRRQEILDPPHPTRFRFFMHEQALRLQVGGAAIMHEQMLKLVLLAALDHLSIRIVPSSARERSAFGGPFRLFEYRQYPPLVYLDNTTTGLFLEDKEYVEPFRELVSAISEVALDEGQSREVIATLAGRYDLRSARDAEDHLEEKQL
jgi:transcriptional regulator with XRE-family HTH domain